MRIKNIKLALLLAGTLALTNPLGAHAKIENSSFNKVVSATESSQDAFQYSIEDLVNEDVYSKFGYYKDDYEFYKPLYGSISEARKEHGCTVDEETAKIIDKWADDLYSMACAYVDAYDKSDLLTCYAVANDVLNSKTAFNLYASIALGEKASLVIDYFDRSFCLCDDGGEISEIFVSEPLDRLPSFSDDIAWVNNADLHLLHNYVHVLGNPLFSVNINETMLNYAKQLIEQNNAEDVEDRAIQYQKIKPTSHNLNVSTEIN